MPTYLRMRRYGYHTGIYRCASTACSVISRFPSYLESRRFPQQILQALRDVEVPALRHLSTSNLVYSRYNLRTERESSRQSCLNTDSFSGDGVDELYILGVQEISSIAGEA